MGYVVICYAKVKTYLRKKSVWVRVNKNRAEFATFTEAMKYIDDAMRYDRTLDMEFKYEVKEVR